MLPLLLLFIATPASQAQIQRYQCNILMQKLFKSVAARPQKAGTVTTDRIEDKKFVSADDSEEFRESIQHMLRNTTSPYGLVEMTRRDTPPNGKIFETRTDYVATDSGKFRGRAYYEIDLSGRAKPVIVRLADQTPDLIKFEMKVRREGTEAEPWLAKRVDKPGVVLLKADYDLLMKQGGWVTDQQIAAIKSHAKALTRKGKAVNSADDVDYLVDQYLEFAREMIWNGEGIPTVNARVTYFRDAYEYKFARNTIDPPPGMSAEDLPVKFGVQHTIDRDITIQDRIGGKAASFPSDVRANEIKLPVGYARLYFSGDPAHRTWLIHAGLEELVQTLDFFYLKLKTKEVDVPGFEFIPGKGKLSNGSRLLEALD